MALNHYSRAGVEQDCLDADSERRLLREQNAALLAALERCETLLFADFATPETPDGRRATSAMNHARTAIALAKTV